MVKISKKEILGITPNHAFGCSQGINNWVAILLTTVGYFNHRFIRHYYFDLG